MEHNIKGSAVGNQREALEVSSFSLYIPPLLTQAGPRYGRARHRKDTSSHREDGEIDRSLPTDVRGKDAGKSRARSPMRV